MAAEENALDAVERILGSAQRMLTGHIDLLRLEVAGEAHAALRRLGRSLIGVIFLLVAWGALLCVAFVLLEPIVSLAARFAGIAALHAAIGLALLQSSRSASAPHRTRTAGESAASVRTTAPNLADGHPTPDGQGVAAHMSSQDPSALNGAKIEAAKGAAGAEERTNDD